MKILKVMLALLILLMLVTSGVLYIQTEEGYQGTVSDHFDGTHFFNQETTPDKTLGDLLKWQFNRKEEGSWQAIEQLPSPVVNRQIKEGVTATFINHATVLVQAAGLNILTDPIWSERASPVSFWGPKRYHPPALALEELPPIDAVVISHNHYDHLDLATLKQLELHYSPVFIVGLGNRSLLESQSLANVVELDWWQSHGLNEKVTITGTPAQHWSTRTRLDRNRSLWLGYLISSPEAKVFFAGDTGMGPHFQQIQQRLGPIDLSLLPIGAYLPRWFMKHNHLSPDEALEAHYLLNSRQSMAIHFGTFNLGDDGQYTGANQLKKLLSDPKHQEVTFTIPEPGEKVQLHSLQKQ